MTRRVIIDYTNYRGERKLYELEPKELLLSANQWHPRLQWLLLADVFINDGQLVSNLSRTFAMENIHSWRPADDPR